MRRTAESTTCSLFLFFLSLLLASCGVESSSAGAAATEVAIDGGRPSITSSDGEIDPYGLLIEPEDFPGLGLRIESKVMGNLYQGIKSPKITLRGPDLVVDQWYAFVGDTETGLSLIESVRKDTAPEGIDIFDGSQLFPNSAIIRADHSTGQHITIFFNEGKVNVRVVIRGPVKIDDVIPFAEAARERILKNAGRLP